MSSTTGHEAAGSRVRVSVVVPVFRPKASFDDLIASLDAQTLDREAFEVLLCDDGSGEETAARLESIAKDRPHVRVLSLPHSGWPGTPRNRGVEEARGTYVQFVDQDDWLYPRALERLCDYADEHGSDVVVGKEVGIGRKLPAKIFQRDIPHAVLGEDPILEMLTPHKMFRTAFLREHGIRFPDGKVRLEDHLFVMQAYFAADTISVLASEPCYAWVKEPGSASSSRIDPESYFPHLETVLDVVEANTEPGKVRDRLLRHWFRGKILNRIAGRRMVKYPTEYRDRLLDVVVPLAQRRFGPGVDAGLSFPQRIRAALLRADRRDDLLAFAAFEADTTCTATVTAARWSRGGLQLTVRVRLLRDGEEAFVFETVGPADRLVSLPPSATEDLPSGLLNARKERRADRVDLVARDTATPGQAPESTAGSERKIGGRRPKRLDAVPIALDPMKAFREDGARDADLTVAVRYAGWMFTAPLTAAPDVTAHLGRSPLLAGRRVELVRNEDGSLRLRREWPGGAWRDALARAARRVRSRLRR
ncbi:glycosyltransferase family A protein [Microbacterium paraoxydans]|uniref:glycosyltransferase family 2 protein n=1 Tax=Microbacterium paraoxydans TaxID=199592 RepID=UPI00228695C5|nr:glycosyltransferase family A protein [Microbacterium paraoxydans]MCZ0710892.1 glycosyltransferase family A protein [Microbacterium paraoxydans]